MAAVARFGAVFPADADVTMLPGFARAVEELGYDELWVIEDCFLSGGLALAATALAVTERIRVGIGLMPIPLRNPALAAMEIATSPTCTRDASSRSSATASPRGCSRSGPRRPGGYGRCGRSPSRCGRCWLGRR
jgi:hypothetical protein